MFIDTEINFCYTELGTGLRLGRTPRGENIEKTSFSLLLIAGQAAIKG